MAGEEKGVSDVCDKCERDVWVGSIRHWKEGQCTAKRGNLGDKIECLELALAVQKARAEGAEARSSRAQVLALALRAALQESRCRLCAQTWDAGAVGCLLCTPIRAALAGSEKP